MIKIIRTVLAVGVVLLAGAAVKSALDVVDVSPVSPSSATGPGPVAAKPQVIVPALDEMKETRERPLFVVTRRPADATEVASQADDLRGLTLIGLMRPAGSDGRALIRVEGASSATWVGRGGEISGYVVREIALDGISLERGGRRLNLKLRPTRTALE
ncbi:MAG: hypothetical protein ACXWVS_03300 [Hyphomicrobium sp.]